ncbi:NAD(P)/FAD-dependent oxidoreductase [Alkalispirochaeta americana]|uniref:NAD(P)/FAD-dependent oxidoreductase n=1 Tax=Alkalispirochaeta americana TaxID=159291 RepID=UPI000B956E6C|nr:NAD(P)/FAD-dependent oxidoreductase [Alkalispirochaeta americana]
MSQQKYDVVIVGAGIVGCMIARELSRYKLSVAVVERDSDVGMGQSTANSAIIHSGHDPAPGSLKALLNVRGNELWHQIAPELDIPLDKTGALIVAVGPEEQAGLRPLYERGKENGVKGLEILGREQVLEMEPHLTPDVTGALSTPTAGVVDPFQGVLGAAENAAINGVTFIFDAEVRGMIVENGTLTGIETTKGTIEAQWFINSAGVHSDELMHMVGDHPEFEITARRGEYFVFDDSAFTISSVLFPMPSEKGKGILVTTTTHGNAMVGPNSDPIEDKEDRSVTKEGMNSILSGAHRLVPAVSPRDVIATFAGLRATGNHAPDGKNKDFLIEVSSTVEGLVNLAGIESPGYVSSPAIAEYVAELLRDAGLKLEEKADWQARRSRIPRFRDLSHAERAALVAKNPAYGRIVCRCEEVTEGEIIDAIHSPIPATSYDAIKRRTWLGTGRCQGSFDYPRTMEILARELNVSMTEITKKGPGSVFLYRQTKEEVI